MLVSQTITLPKVGDTITVTVKNRTLGMIVYRPLTTTFEGKVLPSFPWCDKDEFCLSSGTGFIRRIKLHNVEKIMNADGKLFELQKEQTPNVAEFHIKDSKGDTYVVSQTGQKWRCNCVAGQFGRNCKHVEQAKFLK